MKEERIFWGVVCLIVVGSAWAATLTVDDDGPADFRRVQDAIDAAAAGDQVLIFPGYYTGTTTRIATLQFPFNGPQGGSSLTRSITALVFVKDGVSLRGFDAQATVLDAQGRGSVIFANGVGAGTSIEAVTLRGGAGNDLDIELLAYPAGGGILIFGGSPIVTGNIIIGNTAEFGAGVEVSYSYYTPARIERNMIVENNTNSIGGAGIDITNADPIVQGNIITGNTALSGSSVYIFGTVSTSYAYPLLSVSPAIIMNTIAGNQGAGIVLIDGALPVSTTPDIKGNLIYRNAGRNGYGIYLGSADAGVSYNDVFLNEAGNYWPASRDMTGVSGNISAEPLFVDPESGDWRLKALSPCIDGAPFESFRAQRRRLFPAPRGDFEGNARGLDGNHDLQAISDIGAFEFNRGDILGLRFLADAETLSWRPEATAVAYNVYRGPIEALLAGSFGSCFATMDTSLLDVRFTDSEVPLTGSGFFYLVSQRDAAGEQSLGFDSRGMERVNAAPCP